MFYHHLKEGCQGDQRIREGWKLGNLEKITPK